MSWKKNVAMIYKITTLLHFKSTMNGESENKKKNNEILKIQSDAYTFYLASETFIMINDATCLFCVVCVVGLLLLVKEK